MQQGIALLPRMQKVLLRSYSHPSVGGPCQCGQPAAYRCEGQCWKPPLRCATCIVADHSNQPFHHIQHWNGRHFTRTSLKALGLVIHTDPRSGAHRCPASKPDQEEPDEDENPADRRKRAFVVVHTNGFHTVDIKYCFCPGEQGIVEEWEQLLAVGLFPASWRHPRTAFTLDVLRQFHVHSLTSKKSTYDFVGALAALTNATFPQDVDNRTREFQRSFRFWRKLSIERRMGQAHGIDSLVPHRQPGSLAVRCPTCPEVNFNVSEATLKDAPEEEIHKHTLFLSVDGNFKMQRKNKGKCSDPDDVALNNGHAYFPDNAKYLKYLQVAKPIKEDENLAECNHFRAERLQNKVKFKNVLDTGVVAVQCARHGFYLHNGMVDLKKGEGFANTDFAVCMSPSEQSKQRRIMFMYDIWCQYVVNLKKRLSTRFQRMLPIILLVVGAIPKMHIHAHIDLCALLWNLNWLVHSAMTVGEMIETGWAEHNLTSGSTKEMNCGHRHDSIDDTSGHWNWQKLIKITAALVRLYRICVLEIRRRKRDFDGCNALTSPEHIAEWEKMDTTPQLDKDGKFVGPPTHAAAYEKMVAQEKTTTASTGLEQTSACALVAEALLLENDQVAVRRLVVQKASADVLAIRRARLVDDLNDHRQRLVLYAPELVSSFSPIDPDTPENEKLHLASDFSESQREELNVCELASVEHALREGSAYDALRDLRLSIQTLNVNIAFKAANIHGTNATTRAQRFLKTLSNDIQVCATGYRLHRKGLVALGMEDDHASLKPLLREELRGKDGKAMAAGQVKDSDPWFWRAAQPSDLSEKEEAEWCVALERARWHRLRALLKRAEEEKETLEEEFQRTITAFGKMQDIWRSLAADAEEPGSKAYAEKQGSMYEELKDRCQKGLLSLPELIAKDLKKEEEKEAKEAEAARQKNNSPEQDEENFWDMKCEWFPPIRCATLLLLWAL
ncbi:hypothetical protein R3P38DRAFT_2579598 [Favolaschia claudopus]|uniref:CxC2-like cysteine cluster KDZ transposase-associated domain-containing protein n=1 Tax=Favolaschia claudopus TaxID=2862362 RepID=A0AAV9ZE09_9AGAR